MSASCSKHGNASDSISRQPLGTAAAHLHMLQGLYDKLTILRREMHDLAEWRSAQPDDHPMPRHVFLATESSMDRLSEEAMRICDSMATLTASTIAGLKCKASALDYLLPEEPETHITLCRSLCADIRSL